MLLYLGCSVAAAFGVLIVFLLIAGVGYWCGSLLLLLCCVGWHDCLFACGFSVVV